MIENKSDGTQSVIFRNIARELDSFKLNTLNKFRETFQITINILFQTKIFYMCAWNVHYKVESGKWSDTWSKNIST